MNQWSLADFFWVFRIALNGVAIRERWIGIYEAAADESWYCPGLCRDWLHNVLKQSVRIAYDAAENRTRYRRNARLECYLYGKSPVITCTFCTVKNSISPYVFMGRYFVERGRTLIPEHRLSYEKLHARFVYKMTLTLCPSVRPPFPPPTGW